MDYSSSSSDSSSSEDSSDSGSSAKFARTAKDLKEKYQKLALVKKNKIPPLISPLPNPNHPAAVIGPKESSDEGAEDPEQNTPKKLPPVPFPPVQEAKRVSHVGDQDTLPVVAISMRPSHLYLRCYGLDVLQK